MHTQSIVPPRIDYGKISADKYDPNSTYKKGDLRIQYNTLWKAKQDIDIAEPWTESHWESTNLAEVIGSVYSSLNSSLKMNTENITDGVIVYYNACTVTIKFAMATKSYTADTWNTIATIPENLRPASELIFAALNNNVSTDATNTPVWVKITSSGNLQVYVLQDRSTIAPVGTISYAI